MNRKLPQYRMTDKRSLRTHFKAVRAQQMPANDLIVQVCSTLAMLPEVQDASRLHCYFSIGTEMPTLQFLQSIVLAANKSLYVPACFNNTLSVWECPSLDSMTTDDAGIPIPAEGRSIREDAWLFDVIICPGLAFDRNGMRLGYGKGHYDQFLLRCKGAPTKIGLCFDAQIAEALPYEKHDIPMDIIVSEKRTLRLD